MFNTKIFNRFRTISSTALTFMVAVWFLLGLNFVLVGKVIKIISDLEHPNIVFVATVPIFFFCALVFLFTPFISRYIAKPFLIFALITSACVNYGAYNFGVIFNKDMMVNIFETTASEATSYLNLKLIIWLFLSGVVPAIYVGWVKIEFKPFLKELKRKAIVMAGCLGVIGLIAAFFYADYASVARNNPKLQKDIIPTYYIASTVKYIKQKYFTEDLPYKTIGTDAVRVVDHENEKYLFVVLIGETARAQNYQTIGYDRPTNEFTKNISNVMTFQNVSSCGTATAISLPCMFSLMKKKDFSQHKFESQDNVVDILKYAGYHQVWLDNNTGCKGVCRHIEYHAVWKLPQMNCKAEECTDGVFLQVLDDTIDKMNGEDAVIYVHLLGSHGPSYYERYPAEFAYFKPDCQTSNIGECSKEELINTYDNTIRYTDYVMAQIINELKKFKDHYYTGLLYLSDHGESLGENGLYLHGMPYAIAPDEQTHVPLMLWLSDEMISHEQLDMQCLEKSAREQHYSHDNLSASLLGILDVKTTAYDEKMDLFHACVHEEGE